MGEEAAKGGIRVTASAIVICVFCLHRTAAVPCSAHSCFSSTPLLSSLSASLSSYFLVSYSSTKKKGMGRTFSSTVTTAPVVISPGDSHDEIYPHYTRWSYENSWDPDSDAFFKDAVYEAVVSSIPLEPITPVDSSDDSSSASSGRGTPAELPPVPGQVLPSDHEVNRWLDGTSPSNDATAALDGLPPLPTPRRHSTSEPRRRSTQSLGVSPAAFERFHARRLSRARVVQYLPAFVPDSDSDTDAPASVHPGVSVRTSEITPIQLPLSHHPRGALQHTLPLRPVTPPPAPAQSVPIPAMTPNGDALQPSPPPSVSPRIYNWSVNAYSAVPAPESPTVPSRIRVPPARWPVY